MYYRGAAAALVVYDITDTVCTGVVSVCVWMYRVYIDSVLCVVFQYA